jgi:hypothetical protein
LITQAEWHPSDSIPEDKSMVLHSCKVLKKKNRNGLVTEPWKNFKMESF